MKQIFTQTSLYEQDFALWLEDTASKIGAGQFTEIDKEILAEEIEALGRSEKQELENRLFDIVNDILFIVAAGNLPLDNPVGVTRFFNHPDPVP
jgi:hypothetical protein